MKLENTFTIPVPADQAWPVLLDLERLAPCVPGATITSREGDDYHGRIKVKLGPVGLSYKGIIKVVSQDESAGIAVLEGSGRENRGNGTANAQDSVVRSITPRQGAEPIDIMAAAGLSPNRRLTLVALAGVGAAVLFTLFLRHRSGRRAR